MHAEKFQVGKKLFCGFFRMKLQIKIQYYVVFVIYIRIHIYLYSFNFMKNVLIFSFVTNKFK